jgi:sterol O-acyltransferase
MGNTFVYFVFPSSTPRLGLELDLLIFSFGQLPLALMTWVPMFLSTLLVPYQALRLWARPRASSTWILGAGMGCALLAIHVSVLCVLPVHIAREHHLPPASRCVLVFEQVRPALLQGREDHWAFSADGWS